MAEQEMIFGNILEEYRSRVRTRGISRFLLVCGNRMAATEIGKCFSKEETVAMVFRNFSPNPSYESVKEAIVQYKENHCDGIFAIGGGSAIDLAKCVKAFLYMGENRNYLENQIEKNDIPLWVMPSTAGTGSEATSFAVIYYNGRKRSVEDISLIPEVVFFESSLLLSLPLYQKKATLLDAFCHCVESFWSVNATAESQEYARTGLQKILRNYRKYLDGDVAAAECMLMASNYAGKAINIAKTTAAHAMCYQMTKLYGLPHGHAAAVCLHQVWKYTYEYADDGVLSCLRNLALLLGNDSISYALEWYDNFLLELGIFFDRKYKKTDIEDLVQSVNLERLKNHPVIFSEKAIKEMYIKILEKGGAHDCRRIN